MNETTALWIPLRGANGYQVSNTGLVCNRSDADLIPFIRNGVPTVIIYGKRYGHTSCKSMGVAELVAECWLEPPREGEILINLDGNVNNVCQRNLKWVNVPTYLESQFGGEWRLIDDSDIGGVYYVSSTGKVWSLRTRQLLAQRMHAGYPAVTIGWPTRFRHVHRLVAKAFHANEEILPMVNHKDGDKTDSSTSNLEWSTYSDNSIHSVTVLGHKQKGGSRPKVRKDDGGVEFGIPGYLVYRDGRVYSKKSRIYLGQQINDSGYMRVSLRIEGKSRQRSVHSIVAKAFMPPRPSEKHEVNHIDENKTNNHVDNLEWSTKRDNMIHSAKLHPERAARFQRSVVQLSLDNKVVKIHSGIKEACRETGVNSGSIVNACKGISPTAGGFRWKYNEVELA